MREETRNQRREEIMDTAITVLTERGYHGASMVEVARRASASKETLYSWFGNKRGLFEAVIHRNAASVQSLLKIPCNQDSAPKPVLIDFGCALLTLLLGEASIALNRAAIAETTADSSLAEVLTATGREETLPLFLEFLGWHQTKGNLRMHDINMAAEQFIGLLVGDLQIRRLLGVISEPGKKTNKQRATEATTAFLRLYGV